MKCPTHKLNRLHISYIELRVYIYIEYIILYCIVLYYIILYYNIYICMHCIIYTLSFTTLK